MENNLTEFSLKNILIWTCAFCIMEFPMRYFYLKVVGGKNVEKWYNFKDFSIYTHFKFYRQFCLDKYIHKVSVKSPVGSPYFI